jgi:hypothetical protein
MGGYGSGPYVGKQSKSTVSACYGIDIRQWKREGLLRTGHSFGWKWTGPNGQTASIGVNVPTQDQVKLAYTVIHRTAKIPVVISIDLGYSDCNYGGRRSWFYCPDCFERVAWLYLRGTKFKCRICHGLTYRSCQESGNAVDEQMRRVNRVLEKLKSGKKHGFDIMHFTPTKPKGMHWDTYWRLLPEYQGGQLNYITALSNKFELLRKR